MKNRVWKWTVGGLTAILGTKGKGPEQRGGSAALMAGVVTTVVFIGTAFGDTISVGPDNWASSGGLYWSQTGWKIRPNQPISLTSVTKESGSSLVTIGVYDASKQLLAQASISGGVATFNPSVALGSGESYYIVGYATQTNNHPRYKSLTLPIQYPALEIAAGIDNTPNTDGFGNESATTLWDILSIDYTTCGGAITVGTDNWGSSGGRYWSQTGWKIRPNQPVSLTSVTKESGSSLVTIGVYDASKQLLAQASISGDVATFNPSVPLGSGTTYYIAGYATEANNHPRYKSLTLPIQYPALEIAAGIDNTPNADGFGNESTTTLWDIVSIDYTTCAPTLVCPAPAIAECGTTAELAAAVSDPEGNPMVVVWTLNGTAIQTNLVAAGSPNTVSNVSLSGSFPLGTNIVGISVTDGINVVSCSTSITVVDTTPPVMSRVVASPTVLWPPNHQMVSVTIRASVSDGCGPATWKITGVRSNEPVNGRGDGNTSPDWRIAGDHKLHLRAERSGKGDARTYFITVQATDVSGNLSEPKTVTVTVPKSMGKGR